MTSVNISPKRAKRPKVGHRPTHPRIAFIEGLVEALVALHDDHDIILHAQFTNNRIWWARHRIEKEERDHTITHAQFLDALGDLDRLQRRVDDILTKRALRLASSVIPEVERCYHAVEYAG